MSYYVKPLLVVVIFSYVKRFPIYRICTAGKN